MTAAVVVGCLFTRDVWVAAVTLAVVVFIPTAPRLVDKAVGRRGREHWQAYRDYNAEFIDGLQGMTTVKAFNATGALRVIDGSLDLPSLFLVLANEAFRPFRELTGYWHAGYLGIAASGAIADTLTAAGWNDEFGAQPWPRGQDTFDAVISTTTIVWGELVLDCPELAM